MRSSSSSKKLIWFILHPRKWWFYEKWNTTTALIQLTQCTENKSTFKLCCQTSIMILQIFNVYSQVINNVITSLHIFIVLAPKAFILFSSFFVVVVILHASRDRYCLLLHYIRYYSRFVCALDSQFLHKSLQLQAKIIWSAQLFIQVYSYWCP